MSNRLAARRARASCSAGEAAGGGGRGGLLLLVGWQQPRERRRRAAPGTVDLAPVLALPPRRSRVAPGETVRFVVLNTRPDRPRVHHRRRRVQRVHERGTEAYHPPRPGEMSVPRARRGPPTPSPRPPAPCSSAATSRALRLRDAATPSRDAGLFLTVPRGRPYRSDTNDPGVGEGVPRSNTPPSTACTCRRIIGSAASASRPPIGSPISPRSTSVRSPRSPAGTAQRWTRPWGPRIRRHRTGDGWRRPTAPGCWSGSPTGSRLASKSSPRSKRATTVRSCGRRGPP